MNFTMKSYSMLGEANGRAAFKSGVEIGRDKGLKGQALYEYAREFMGNSAYNLGRTARPLAASAPARFLGEETGGRMVGQMAYGLQSYVYNYLGSMMRFGNGSFDKMLTPAQRTANKKALTTLLGHTALLSGGFGLPFVGAALELLERQGLVELEPKEKLAEALAQLFGEDEETGSLMTDTVLYGLANSLTQGTPLSGLGNKFAIGGALGFNSYDGFNTKSLLGPTSSLIQKVGYGGANLLEGEFARAAQSGY